MSEAIPIQPAANQPVPGAAIYAVLPRIIGECSPIKKDRKNASQGYAFRGVEQVYSLLNLLLEKHGVSIIPEIIGEEREQYDNKNGTRMFRCILRVRYTISASDGSSVCAVVSGEAMDSGDKATPKALSMAYKYMAFQVFCIPTDEKIDTEHESPTVEAAKAPPMKVVAPDEKPAAPAPESDAFARMKSDLAAGFPNWEAKRAWAAAHKEAKESLPLEQKLAIANAFIEAAPHGQKEKKS